MSEIPTKPDTMMDVIRKKNELLALCAAIRKADEEKDTATIHRIIYKIAHL